MAHVGYLLKHFNFKQKKILKNLGTFLSEITLDTSIFVLVHLKAFFTHFNFSIQYGVMQLALSLKNSDLVVALYSIRFP